MAEKNKLPTLEHPEISSDILKEKGVSLVAFCDTVRRRKNGTCTVRLRVTFERVPKYYTTNINVTDEEYLSIATKKVRGELKTKKEIIFGVMKRAYDHIKEIEQFSFEEFDRKIFRKSTDGDNVFYHYDLIIQTLTKEGRVGTADNYRYSLKAVKAFLKENKGKVPEKLSFKSINKSWLESFERFMVDSQEKSITTVGIYLRPLRAVFNQAISLKDITSNHYPFGKTAYVIPNASKAKKALSKEELGKLFNSKPQTPEQEKAKDFWFFSYSCNGMNLKDILLLKWEQVGKESITFVRAKTKRTTKERQTEIIVYLNSFSRSIIKKYGSKDKVKSNLVFDILNKDMSETEKHRAIKNFIRYINQHMKKLAKANKLPEDISTYYARHSFATTVINEGASMEFAMEALGHTDMATTKAYFAGFEDKEKKQIAKNLMNF